jgi:outer membrane receptor protein involved in Fe transport
MRARSEGRTAVAVRPFLFLSLLAALTAGADPVLEEVVVRGSRLPEESSVARSERDVDAAPQAQPLVTADLLRGVPGVFAQQTTPGQGIPIVRGLKGSQVLHLVDGFRINNAFFRNAPNQYPALVPVAALASVELDRGPVATLYGSDAMGGVVNFHTREPVFGRDFGLGGSLGWLSSNQSLRGTVLAAAGGQRHAFEAGISLADVDDRRVGGGERIAPSGYRARSAFLRTRHRIEGGEWGITAQFLEQPRTPRTDELVPGFGQTQPAASEFFFEPNRRDFLKLDVDRELDSPLARSLSLQLGWQRIVDDRRIRDFGDSLRRLEENASELFGASLLLRRDLGAAAELRYGLDISSDEVSSARRAVPVDGGDGVAVPARFPDGSRMDSLGLFADYSWRATPDTRWELGLRYSRFRIDVAATPFGGEAATLRPDDVSARIGLRHDLTPALALTANVGQGFRAPNIFDLSALGPRPGNRFNVANTALDAERIVSSDVGLQLSGENARLAASLFYAEYRDQIVSQPTGELTASGRQIVRSENLGEATLYGAEASAGYLFPGGVTLDAAISWTWGEARSGDEREAADRIPPLNGQLSLTAPLGEWTLEGIALFAAAQDRLSSRDLRDPRINPGGTAGWGVLNLRARRELGAGLSLRLGLDNLFDRRYREHASGLDAPGRGLAVSLSAPL